MSDIVVESCPYCGRNVSAKVSSKKLLSGGAGAVVGGVVFGPLGAVLGGALGSAAGSGKTAEFNCSCGYTWTKEY